MQQKRWQLKDSPPVEFLESFPELSVVAAQLLYNRGLRTQAAIDAFLSPDYQSGVHDPFLFRDMEKAVTRIWQAIDAKEKIVIFGDYDADGITGSVVGSSVFSALKLSEGEDFEVYLPDRETEGYGLNIEAINYLALRGTKVIITADNGITALLPVEHANACGIDVIITDHHSIPKILPKAYAVLNPRLPEETYPCKLLCGAGTLFKLMQGVLARYEERNTECPQNFREITEKWLLDIVAIGTVADMVPLLEENRIFVKYGLLVLNKTRRLGLQKLVEKCNGTNRALSAPKEKKPRRLDTHSIGFQIAPRINAAGRMDHSSLAYRLLITEDREEAEALSSSLNSANSQRQRLTDSIVKEATEKIEQMDQSQKIFIVKGEHWPAGLIGLVAGRLLNTYSRPVVVVSESPKKIIGSARSVPGFDVIATLREMGDAYFKNYGGHPAACGFTLGENVSLEEFQHDLLQRAERKIEESTLLPVIEIDAQISLADATWDLVSSLEAMEPFGKDNPQPIFFIPRVEVVEISRIGADESHLRIRVKSSDDTLSEHTTSCIGFSMGERAEKFQIGSCIDLAAHVDVNEWNGHREIQLKVVDLRLAEPL